MPDPRDTPPPMTRRALVRDCHVWAFNRLLLYLSSTRFWMVVVACVVVTGIAGPFNTLLTVGTVWRMVYWVLVLLPAIVQQFYLSMLVRELARRTDYAWGWAALFAGVLGSVSIFAWTAGINNSLFSNVHNFSLAQLGWSVFGLVIPLTLVVNAFMPTLQPLWGMRQTKRPPLRPLSMSDTEPSPLFDRLPPDLGRDVITVRAANHHLEVTTTRGHARVLMRLADAEADLATLPGMRVHRSWWVNLTMVSHTENRQGSTDLILTTGVRIPVSRALRATLAQQLGERAAK